jgi:outer membrane protein OmpA-like peptidoglycan-associated protein
MKTSTLILVIFINSLVFSQSNTFHPQLRFSPHFGVGWAMPPFIDGTNSNLLLKSNPLKNYTIGEITTSSGAKKQIHKMTNTIGIDANYSVSKQWAINLGVNRAMHINLLRDPDPVRVSSTTEYSAWIYAYKYTSYIIGARYSQYDKFFQCNIHHAGLARKAIENDNGVGFGIITNGNGLSTNILSRKENTFIISPEYGIAGVSSFDLPMEMSIGLHIPTSIFSKEQATFIRNGSNAGINNLNFTQAAVWLRVRAPFIIWSRNPKTPKSKIVTKPVLQKTVEYEGKKVTIGEKIILKSLQFEQTKDVLSPSAMSELDKVEQLMQQSSTMIIKIIGHTSDEGDHNSNMELSIKRAKSCKVYLQRKGIKSNRILVLGMGPDAPISRTDKSLNRRVEMQIIRM